MKRLQDWIALPSIAAEGLNSEAGAERMMALLKEAGFQRVERVATDGKPGVFATLTPARRRPSGPTMYDEAVRSREWSSPPLEARIVTSPASAKS
ncbi:MAG: hypothetical protein IPL96_17765 [Holophagaceae bacterium]|nr:hypothetical protein [Holophagaceae bacterium]